MKALKAGLIGSHIQATRLPRALALMCEDAGIALDFELIDTGDRPDVRFHRDRPGPDRARMDRRHRHAPVQDRRRRLRG